MMFLQGKIIETLNIKLYRPINVQLGKINKHMGLVNTTYYNFCFNEMGFLTHDTAI